jgi:hypothetical protein
LINNCFARIFTLVEIKISSKCNTDLLKVHTFQLCLQSYSLSTNILGNIGWSRYTCQTSDLGPAELVTCFMLVSCLAWRHVPPKHTSSKSLLKIAKTVVLVFGPRRDPWPNVCLFEDRLCDWKCGLLFDERRGRSF